MTACREFQHTLGFEGLRSASSTDLFLGSGSGPPEVPKGLGFQGEVRMCLWCTETKEVPFAPYMGPLHLTGNTCPSAWCSISFLGFAGTRVHTAYFKTPNYP